MPKNASCPRPFSRNNSGGTLQHESIPVSFRTESITVFFYSWLDEFFWMLVSINMHAVFSWNTEEEKEYSKTYPKLCTKLLETTFQNTAHGICVLNKSYAIAVDSQSGSTLTWWEFPFIYYAVLQTQQYKQLIQSSYRVLQHKTTHVLLAYIYMPGSCQITCIFE